MKIMMELLSLKNSSTLYQHKFVTPSWKCLKSKKIEAKANQLQRTLKMMKNGKKS